MNKNFLALLFILMSSLAFSEPSESEDIPPPDEVYNYDPAVDEPEITIIEEEDEFIEEYRLNGNLYMMKISPKNMPPYYLIKEDPNADWIRRDTQDQVFNIPMWVIGTF